MCQLWRYHFTTALWSVLDVLHPAINYTGIGREVGGGGGGGGGEGEGGEWWG